MIRKKTNLVYGHFLDYEDNIEKCICSRDIKCYKCSIESINNNLCISCNNNYYSKINDNTNIVPYINCYKDLEGYYLDNNIYKSCYSSCKNCKDNGNEKHHNCVECITGYIFIGDKGHENNCYKKCPYSYFLDESNKYNCINLSTKGKEEILDNFDNLIIDKEPNQTYIINGEDYSIIIKPIDAYIDGSTVNINFTECSKLLQKQYPSDEFRMVQINIKNSNENCLTDDVEYKIYNQNGKNIDLSPCEKVKINIEYKIKDISLLKMDEIEKFNKIGVDIFNIKDDFFNDICFPYSDDNSNSDMILDDRVTDIYINYSICEKGCEYEAFNIENMSSNCNCELKKDLSKEAKEGNFKTYFSNSFIDSNFGVIKCYLLVFGIKGKLNNVGFWLFGIILILHIPLYIIYFINTIRKVVTYINNEMENKGYKISNNKIFQIDSLNTSLNIQTTKTTLQEESKKSSFNINKRKKRKKKKSKSKFHKNNLNNIKDNPPKKINIAPVLSSNNIDTNKKDIINNFDLRRKSENIKKFDKQNNNLISEFYSNESFIENNKELKKQTSKNENNKLDNVKNSNITKEFPLILINANNNEDYKPLKSNYILNNYNYEEAIHNEERNIFRIFFIYLINKNNIFNLIFINPPLELKPLRILIFIFNYACSLSLNAFFYLSDKISDKYHYTGKNKLLYTLVNNLSISITSTIVNFLLLYFLQALIQSSNKIEKLFKEQDNLLKSDKNYQVNQDTILNIKAEIAKIMKCLKIKINLFFCLELLVMLFFYYYVTAFCHVYESTQTSWLLDSISSYVISFIISFVLSLIGAILYKISIKYKIKILYKMVIFIYCFC